MAAPVQWLAAGGGPANVMATTRSALPAQRGDTRRSRLVVPKPRCAFVLEPLLPAPDHCLGLTGRSHDLGSTATIGRQKNDLHSPKVFLPAVAVRHHRFELAAVGGAQSDVPSLVYSSDSHTRVPQGIPHANRSIRFVWAIWVMVVLQSEMVYSESG
jgi:hypothetical protein